MPRTYTITLPGSVADDLEENARNEGVSPEVLIVRAVSDLYWGDTHTDEDRAPGEPDPDPDPAEPDEDTEGDQD